ncbi:hypothetical protein [Streptomyces sp. HD]|uniref:hypothetical protein n=1 Tax=Streptomyces sp. HD TaxID=3020892 RepID=UPI00232BF370|nr:hypothetical protein [Streptomyces sp. HD]MDC0769608.1 hypothetical protein [Streptomyces sp. HD]
MSRSPTLSRRAAIPAALPPPTAVGQLAVIVLMFTGRLGPITLAFALAPRECDRRYTLPGDDPQPRGVHVADVKWRSG